MGLTEKEAAQRLKENGENSLGEGKKTSPVTIFFGQFRDVMVLILLAATVISVILGEVTDAVTIILIVLLNAILGFIQEFRTEKTLEALKSMTAPTAKCWRDARRNCSTCIPMQNGFNVADYVKRVFHMYADDASEIVSLKCRNSMMKYVIDRFVIDVKTQPLDDEYFKAIVEVSVSPTFFGWIFQFGGDIQIIKPESVRIRFERMGKKIFCG